MDSPLDPLSLIVCTAKKTIFDYDFRSMKLEKFVCDKRLEVESEESTGSNDVTCAKRRRKMSGTKRSDKVTWDRDTESQFIVLCHQEHLNKQLNTTIFTRYVLGQICEKLNAIVGGRCVYNVDQCKTKWKNIKRAWRLLHDLRFKRGSGLGWDPWKNTIVGTEEQLLSIYKEHRDNKAIINRGLPFFDLCTEMFDKKIATGDFATFSGMQHNDDDDDDSDTQNDIPTPVDPTNASGSRSMPNFSPSSNSQGVSSTSHSSGKKRSFSAADRNACIVTTMTNLNDHLSEKRSKAGDNINEYKTCYGIVKAMEGIPIGLRVKAGERLRGHATRIMFLEYDEDERRAWVMSLA